MQTSSLPVDPVLVIAPSRRWVPVDFGALWAYRELLYFLAWRDVKIRYKQSVLGVAWAVLQPLLTMLVFTLFFGRLANMPSDGHPYPLFAFAGILPWTFFANAVTTAGTSLVQNSQLISKVYFPRLLMPAATVLAAVVDLFAAMLLLLLLLPYYGAAVGWNLLGLPLLVLATVIIASAVGTFVAAVNVKYRDVRYAVPFLLQLLMFGTPIIYPSSLVPEQWRPLLNLNPLAALIDGYRTALLGGSFNYSALAIAFAVSLFMLLLAALYFRSVERHFADVI